jgi:glutamyl-tRNA reductase
MKVADGRGRLIVLGLSHRTAPVAQREKAVLDEPAARSLLAALRRDPAIREAAVLCTCNRTELFAVVADRLNGEAALARALVEHSAISADELASASYVHGERSAARHLFRVASSLDSMVLGESEIQGQVRAARELARAQRTLGPLLDRAFTQALRAGRRVRVQTHVAAGALSVSSVAVDLARTALGDLGDRRALLIGAGRAAEATARALLGHGLAEVVVANRTPATARRLAARFGGRAAGLGTLAEEMTAVDVVISSTDSAKTIIDASTLARVLAAGRRRPLVIIDIAVPRDVDPRVGELRGVRLHNIDDIRRVAEANLNGRRREAARAELMIAEEVRRFALPGGVRARGDARDPAVI